MICFGIVFCCFLYLYFYIFDMQLCSKEKKFTVAVKEPSYGILYDGVLIYTQVLSFPLQVRHSETVSLNYCLILRD